ncbi:MAG: hypothetical protein ACRD12_14400 [Acidimicrobiales bacterium]
MSKSSRRRVKGGVAVGMTVTGFVALAVLGATAFACTNLATISLSSNNGHVGDRITLVGTSFPVPRASSGAAATPVTVRWKSSDGEVIATATPDRTGTISATFTVPQTEPGNLIIIATQRRPIMSPDRPEGPPATYVDEAGTPARAAFRVLAKGELAPIPPTVNDFIGANADAGSTGIMVLMVLFGAVALSLFAGGVIAFLHQVRTRRYYAAMPEKLYY